MAGGVFHVEFGINETPLTTALEHGNYLTAEKIIRECNNPSSLDEGCYQRTPLFICLCGIDEEEKSVTPRNLYLAKLLVEYGANVNHRVPTTFFGSEYEGPGQSPLELLTDFYNELTRHKSHHKMGHWLFNCGWDPNVDIVIGLNKQILSSLEDVIEHVEELVFVILGNGGDPNVIDVSKRTLLHKISMISSDVHLLRLLVENGANVNSVDCYGNTPWTALCDVSASDVFDYLEDLSPCSDDSMEDTSCNLTIKKDFLNYFLKQKDLLINHQNNRGQTALFHCIIRGDVDACYRILKAGADPSIKGTVWETRKKKKNLSPIFVSFLSIPLQRKLSWQNLHHQLTRAPYIYSHLVDAGFFNRKEIAEEIGQFLEQDFPEFAHLRGINKKLVNMMFGKTSASLQQLAARQIFKQCFLKGSCSLGKLMPADSLKNRYSGADLKLPDIYNEYMTLGLNQTVLKALVAQLGLPMDSLINFEVELFLHQMACRFSSYKVLPPENMFGQESDDSSLSEGSLNSSSEDGGDSDLEYW